MTTSTTETKKSSPTHKLYRVVKGRTHLDKSIWTEVAACWQHKDGNGFNVKFKNNEAPAPSGEYVMRRDTRRTPHDEA